MGQGTSLQLEAYVTDRHFKHVWESGPQKTVQLSLDSDRIQSPELLSHGAEVLGASSIWTVDSIKSTGI